MHLRKVVLVSVALLSMALLISPALAAPSKMTAGFNARGITTLAGDWPGQTEIVGSDIQLSGVAMRDATDWSIFRGQAVFIDKTLGLKARSVSVDSLALLETVCKMHGTAEVTVGGKDIGTYVYYMEFSEDDRNVNFYLIGLPGNELWTQWFVPSIQGGLHTN